MNSDLYLAVVDAMGPRLVEIAHSRLGMEPPRRSWYGERVELEKRPLGAPEFDLELPIRQFLKYGSNARTRKKPTSELAAAIINMITVLGRGAIDTARYDDRKDRVLVTFNPGLVRFEENGAHRSYGSGANVTYQPVYRKIIIGERSFTPDYFGLRDYTLPKENV